MERFQDGDWFVFREKTRKPFVRFRTDASRGLQRGLSAFSTVFRWEGSVCRISSPGAVGELSFATGERGWNIVTCRVRITGIMAYLLQAKILSDIEQTTIDVCEAIVSENKNVFIVHGHSLANREELAEYLRARQLHPIILDQQDDLGMTIIEKFECYGTDCSFAFVLMTPDDRGGSQRESGSQWRARQNVILELGWFMARLGRERVVILYRGELEIPSDISGVLYLKFEKNISEAQDRIDQRLRGALLIP